MRGIGALARWAAGLLLAALFFVLLAQVVLRPLGVVFSWVEEFAIFAFIWLVFFSVAVAHSAREQLCVTFGQDYAFRRISTAARRGWTRLNLWAEIAFLLVFAVGLMLMVPQSWGMFAGSLFGFRYGYLYLGVLAAVVLSLVLLIHDAFDREER